MKTVFRIFGILAILIALLFCGLSVYRTLKDKEESVTAIAEAKAQIAQNQQQADQLGGEAKIYINEQIAEAEKLIAQVPSGTTYTIIAALLAALLVLALVFGVLLFRTNVARSQQLLLIAVVLLVAAYFVSPDIDRGAYGGMENRTLALLSGIPVVVAGLFAWLTAKRNASIQ